MKIEITEDNEELADEVLQICYNALIKQYPDLAVVEEDIEPSGTKTKIILEMEELR